MCLKQKKRNITVDLTRTFAIVLMVIFHFIYDLRSFGYHDWNIPDGPGWEHWRRVIVSLFLLCVGVSLVYAHASSFKWKGFSYRFLQLSFGAAIISIVTYRMYPQAWVFFGVLHFIAIASVLSIPLINRPRVALVAGIGLLLLTYLEYAEPRWPYYELFSGIPKHPSDFVPLIPWLGVVWIGIATGHSQWLKRDPLANTPYHAYLKKPGQHSLAIYLIHQPVIVGVLFLVQHLSESSS